MSNKITLPKFTLIITTRCNLKCKLCCEYIPQNAPFPDMTVHEARVILEALFETVDHVGILHLSGGGEPFLHRQLAELIDVAFEFADRFDNLMVFTNSTVKISDNLLETLKRYRDKLIVHASDYGLASERTAGIYKTFEDNGVNYRTVKYYGDSQDFGGWVDFGQWESRGRATDVLASVFQNCAVTRDMRGNWRTRDGKVHWCSRSQRGMELGTIPDNPDDYVDLLDKCIGVEEKREKFRTIERAKSLRACDHCSGDQGTSDVEKRFTAAEQME